MPFCAKAVFAMPATAARRANLATDVIYLEELERDLDSERAFAGDHRCCAERRLLQAYVQQARKQGVAPHKLVSWVRRKVGGSIIVWRRTADGDLACAAPCLFCSRELQRFDLQVHCALGGGRWFSGKLSDDGAPPPYLTGGQQKVFRPQGWAICDEPPHLRAHLPQPKPRQQGHPPFKGRQR